MKRLKESYDVVVVGCGPGGAMAGKYAARNGAKVLVIDKKREVGLPVYDTASVIYDLAELEHAAGFPFNRARCAEYQLAGNGFISPSGKFGGIQPWLDGWAMRRPELEKELAVSAGRDGAQIMMDTKFIDVVRENGKVAGVIIQQGEERVTVPCKIVIGADGVYSRVAKRSQIKVPTDIMVSLGRDFVGVKRLVPVDAPFYELYMVPELAGYFCWVAPHSDDRLGVAIAFQPDLLKTGETAREIHNRFIKHLEKIGRFDFSNAAEVAMMSGTTTAVKDAPDKLAEDGIMLVGDAAWRPLFVSNWGSPGIPTAVTSGRFAGETAAAAIKAGDVSENFLKVYEERLKATFEGSGITPESLVEARQLYFKLLSAAPEVQDAAVEAIGDQYSSLHLYLRGARPLAGCIDKIKEWWAQNPQYN